MGEWGWMLKLLAINSIRGIVVARWSFNFCPGDILPGFVTFVLSVRVSWRCNRRLCSCYWNCGIFFCFIFYLEEIFRCPTLFVSWMVVLVLVQHENKLIVDNQQSHRSILNMYRTQVKYTIPPCRSIFFYARAVFVGNVIQIQTLPTTCYYSLNALALSPSSTS